MTAFWIFMCLLVILLILTPASPRDDTDPPEGHSGMKLYVDHRTGCHYLGNPWGGITPRLDAKGKHVCEGGRS